MSGKPRKTNPQKITCSGRKSNGDPCPNWAINGGTVCGTHGGRAPQVKTKAAIRAEVRAWGLGDVHVDPGEVLLRLVSQSSARVELYARLLEEAYDAAERLSQAEDETIWGLLKSDKEERSSQAVQARDDLDRIFNGGGVAALVGNTYGAAKDVGVYRTEVALTVQAELEARAEDADQLRRTHVERARHRAELARRRYLAVDPDNRLVADTSEADWNDALRTLRTAQDAYERGSAATATLTEEHKTRIRALAADFPALWSDPATPARERKRMTRLLIDDVTWSRPTASSCTYGSAAGRPSA